MAVEQALDPEYRATWVRMIGRESLRFLSLLVTISNVIRCGHPRSIPSDFAANPRCSALIEPIPALLAYTALVMTTCSPIQHFCSEAIFFL